MYTNVNQSLFLLLGCFLRASYQIQCIQCSSSIDRDPSSDDHSCLDATAKPLTCVEPTNKSENSVLQCMSTLYRIGPGLKGVIIYRDCMYGVPHARFCDRILQPDDLYGKIDLLCRYPCREHACNRHRVTDIINTTSRLFRFTEILFVIVLYFLYLWHFQYH